GVKELKSLASKHGLLRGGNKSDLIKKIISNYEETLISYKKELEDLRNKHSIVTDLNDFISNVYVNDDRLSRLIKRVITSESVLNDVINLLGLNSEELSEYNNPNIEDEIKNILK